MSVNNMLSENAEIDENSSSINFVKFEVFSVLKLCVLVIDRLCSVLMYKFATELIFIVALILSLLIY